MKSIGDTIFYRLRANKKFTGGNDPSKVCEKGFLGYKGKDPDPQTLCEQNALNFSREIATKIINGTYIPSI
jgi:hypothetical protein